MTSVKGFNLVLTLFACLLWKGQFLTIPKEPKVLASSVVTNCDEVIQLYKRVGYPVTDCMYVTSYLPYMFYRLDAKLTYQEANLACQTASYTTIAVSGLNTDSQMQLNDLYKAKFLLNTWMWLGLTRVNGTMQWVDGSGSPPSARWYPYADSTTNGDCAVMMILANNNGDKDVSGTFYYTEDCNNKYIAACLTSVP